MRLPYGVDDPIVSQVQAQQLAPPENGKAWTVLSPHCEPIWIHYMRGCWTENNKERLPF